MKRTLTILFASIFATVTIQAQTAVRDTAGTASAIGTATDILAGAVSGVEVISPEGNPLLQSDIRIRGINSVRTDNRPLIIVDGVRLSNDAARNCDPFWQYEGKEQFFPNDPLAFLNPRDIEKIEVLKNASETAAYGLRGANGVIIITTKGGLKEGREIKWESNAGYSRGFSHNHTMDFRGKTGNTSYYISGGYLRRGAEVPAASDYGTVRTGIDSHAGKIFDFGMALTMGVGQTRLSTNPDFDNNSMEYRGLASAYLNVNFLQSLRLRANLGFNFQDNVRSVWYGLATPFGGPLNGAAAKQSSLIAGGNGSVALEFDKYFNVKHHLKAALVGDLDSKYTDYNTENGNDALSGQLRGNSISTLNSHFYPRAFTIRYRNYGAQAALHYDYDALFGIDGSFRAAFSPKFTGSAPVLLPSAEAWVDLHRIIMPASKGCSMLKIEGGYGVSAIEEMTPYEMLGSFVPNRIADVQTGAESFYTGLVRLRTAEWHAGFRSGFAGGRVEFSASYYKRNTADNYYLYCFGNQVDYKGSKMWNKSDNPTVVDNFCSDVLNHGVEGDIRVVAIKRKGLTLAFNASASWNFNTVEGCEQAILHGLQPYTVFADGKPAASLYGLRTNADGSLRDITGEGQVTSVDRVILGSTTPVYLYSFGAEFKWRKLYLEALLYGAGGHKAADLAAMAENGDPVFSDKYLLDASYLRLGRVAAKYYIPLKTNKKCALKGLDVKAGACNVPLLGIYPAAASFFTGVSLKFK